MLNREEWVESQLMHFNGCREDVITFISKILYNNPDSDDIRILFHAGYCYYFALMLKDAFGGQMCWHKGYSHIVWKDETDCCYDIEGVFCDYNEGTIVPLEALGADLESFKHRGADIPTSQEMVDEAYFNTILLNPLWLNTDISIKEISEAFKCIPSTTKPSMSAQRLLELISS